MQGVILNTHCAIRSLMFNSQHKSSRVQRSTAKYDNTFWLVWEMHTGYTCAVNCVDYSKCSDFSMAKALCSRPDQCSFGAGVIPSDVEHDSCTIYTKLVPTLQTHFGFGALKPGQAEAILALLHGHDVFVRMATGSGKSVWMFLLWQICMCCNYQLVSWQIRYVQCTIMSHMILHGCDTFYVGMIRYPNWEAVSSRPCTLVRRIINESMMLLRLESTNSVE